MDRNKDVTGLSDVRNASLSARRAWIEISPEENRLRRTLSLSARRAWIEIRTLLRRVRRGQLSLSARRAWIEMAYAVPLHVDPFQVALRKESVDRNGNAAIRSGTFTVALRKESVDRN